MFRETIARIYIGLRTSLKRRSPEIQIQIDIEDFDYSLTAIVVYIVSLELIVNILNIIKKRSHRVVLSFVNTRSAVTLLVSEVGYRRIDIFDSVYN
jgi:hypothetical protein